MGVIQKEMTTRRALVLGLSVASIFALSKLARTAKYRVSHINLEDLRKEFISINRDIEQLGSSSSPR